MKMGILFNGLVAAALAVPIVRLPALLGHARAREAPTSRGCRSARSAGFPEGETRLATFRNPYVMPTDGKTADTACWVRRIAGDEFQVFAVNCAHLGCPVRWFPQSGLFMCPCHGGAYYRDGARASGPPERGLFEYPYKVEGRRAHASRRGAAHAGREPPPSRAGSRHAPELARIGEWFDARLQLAAPDPRSGRAPGAAEHRELVVRVRQRRPRRLRSAVRDRHPARPRLRARRRPRPGAACRP